MIELKPLKKEDINKIVQWNEGKSLEFLFQWAGHIYKSPLTEEQIVKYLKDEKANEDNELLVYKIVLENTDEMVGTFELKRYNKEENIGRVGRFLVGPEARGKGIGREALAKLMEIGFREVGYSKVCLGVFDFNASAIACYESVGFKKDEVVERRMDGIEGYWNLYEMSISKETWEKQK